MYGLDEVDTDTLVVVEGITDVWRLGPGAVATFGTGYKPSQILMMSQFERIFLLFDSEQDDPNAIKRSEELANTLSSIGKEVEIIELDEGDPGDLKQEDADHLMKDLLRRAY